MQLDGKSDTNMEELDVIALPVSLSNGSVNVEEKLRINENKSSSSVPSDMKKSKWTVVKAANGRIGPRSSEGEIKLRNIISELKAFAIDDHAARKVEEMSVNNLCHALGVFRRRVVNILRQAAFHYVVIILVMLDLIVVLVDLILAQLSAPCLTEAEMKQYNTTKQRDSCLLDHSVHLDRSDLFLFYLSVVLLGVFVFEVFMSFFAFGWKYFKNVLYLIDGIIVMSSFIMEVYFHYGNIGRAGRAAAAIVVLRLWKIIRAVHAVAHSITLKNRVLIEKIQEAQAILEEEKENTVQTLEKQEIRLEYYVNLLTKIGKLPTTNNIDTYVNSTWEERKKAN